MAKSIFDYDSKIFCMNCGCHGHKSKECEKPITSCGIILYKKNKLEEIKYLLIRRKDTIAYIQIVSGKYASDDICYIHTLLYELSNNEKYKIMNDNFDNLWDELWQKKNIKKRSVDFELSHTKFLRLKSEIINNPKLKDVFLEKIWSEPEWGFPKGRRNYKEKDLQTAKREFSEETSLTFNNINLLSNEPLVEIYKSNDNLHYKHLYYIAEYNGNSNICIDTNNKNQVKEVGDIGFFSYEEAVKKIRNYHKEKKKILQELNEYLLNT
jgi:8-oxo-dGTP pyrophosphatase MutT (NUDIX family)